MTDTAEPSAEVIEAAAEAIWAVLWPTTRPMNEVRSGPMYADKVGFARDSALAALNAAGAAWRAAHAEGVQAERTPSRSRNIETLRTLAELPDTFEAGWEARTSELVADLTNDPRFIEGTRRGREDIAAGRYTVLRDTNTGDISE